MLYPSWKGYGMGRVNRSLLILALLTAGLYAPSTPATARRLPVAAGITQLHGDATSWMRVRLPQPVTVSTKPFDNPLVTVLDGGDIAGVVLKQDVPFGGIEVVGMRADLCPQPRCAGEALATTHVVDPAAERHRRRVTLPAGKYLLYLITNGAPTQVRLKLPGLPGQASFAPTVPARVAFGEPETTSPAPAGPYVYSAEATHNIDGAGISFLALEFDTERFAGASLSSCIEPDQEELDPSDAVACEGGRTAGTGVFTRNDLEGGRKIVMSMGLLGSDSWSHRINYRSAALVDGFEARGFSLSYDTGRRGGWWMYSLSWSY